MTKKYYYDCPIQALYMMKEFGVKFLHWIYPSIHKTEMELLPVGISYLENIIPYFNHKYAFENRFIVAPESEHIFEPKVKDYGLDSQEYLVAHNGVNWGSPHNVRIIIREGKHFFNPKEEN